MAAEFSLNTQMYLLSKKSLWLSDGSMGFGQESDVAFAEGITLQRGGLLCLFAIVSVILCFIGIVIEGDNCNLFYAFESVIGSSSFWQRWGRGTLRLDMCLMCFATPQTIALQVPLSMGFPKQEDWSGLPFPSPGDLPDPRIKPASPALAGGFFTTEPPGNPDIYHRIVFILRKSTFFPLVKWKSLSCV